MFSCRQNRVHTSFRRHYDVVTYGGSSWLHDFWLCDAAFTSHEVRIKDAQFIEISWSFVCGRLLREIDYSVIGRRSILSETIALIADFGQN